MFSTLSAAFTRKVLKRLYLADIDDQLVYPHSQKPTGLPENVIIEVSLDRMLMKVTSAVNNEFEWHGRLSIRSSGANARDILPFLGFQDPTSLEAQRFLDYLANFRYVLFNVKTGEFGPISPNEVLELKKSSFVDAKMYEAALG